MRSVFIVVLLGITGHFLYGQVPLRKDEPVEITHQLRYFIDSTGTISRDEISRVQADFIPAPTEGLRFTDLEGALWIRLEVSNPYNHEEESILIFDDPSLFRITLYESGEPPSLSGTSVDQEARDVEGNHNAFSIYLEPKGVETILARIESDNLITATATIYDDELYHEKARKEYTFLGMFYGVLILIGLYALFLFGATRMRIFILYSAYIVVNILFTGMLDGFTPLYFSGLVKFSEGYLEFILAGVANAMALFITAKFLRTREWSLWLDRLIRFSAWALIIFTTLILIISPGEGFEIMSPLGIIVLVLILSAAALAFRNDIDESGYFLWSFMSYGIFILIFIFNLFRLIPFGFFSQYALHFGILSNLLILSFALGARIYRSYKSSYDEVEMTKELFSMKNIELEQLVWDRTKEVIYKQNELRSIIDNIDNYIWMVDQNYVLRELNEIFARAWEATYGNKLVKGRNMLDQALDPELRSTWKARYDEIFKGHKASFSECYEINGVLRYFEISGYPIEEDGQVKAAAFFTREITDRIQYEKELQAKNTALQKVNEELDSFVYSASHDLKAPLASMQGLVGLAREEKSPDQLKIYFNMMDRSIRRLDQFIKDIIDYSRTTRMETRSAEIDVNELIESVLEDLKYMDPSDKTEILVAEKGTHPLVTDETRLRIILRNLVSNALRYGKPDVGKQIIQITSDVSESQAIFEIRDNGRGIDDEHLPKIFDMFYRANENASGSGLGLYIVRESLKKMGGSVSVTSQVDQGTAFTIVIPNKMKEA